VLKDAQIVSKQWHSGPAILDFDFVSDLAGLGARISTEIGDQVSRVTSELENSFGPDFMRQMAEQFSRKAEAAAEKARKASERKYAKTSTPKSKPAAAKPSPAAAATEDYGGIQDAWLKILKMVESGTISPDEAALLLKALDGD
jgi:hypothetical protein